MNGRETVRSERSDSEVEERSGQTLKPISACKLEIVADMNDPAIVPIGEKNQKSEGLKIQIQALPSIQVAHEQTSHCYFCYDLAMPAMFLLFCCYVVLRFCYELL